MRLVLYALSFVFCAFAVSFVLAGLVLLVGRQPTDPLVALACIGLGIAFGGIGVFVFRWGLRLGAAGTQKKTPDVRSESDFAKSDIWDIQNIDFGSLRLAGCLLMLVSAFIGFLPAAAVGIVAAIKPEFAKQVSDNPLIEKLGGYLLAACCLTIFGITFYLGKRLLAKHEIPVFKK